MERRSISLLVSVGILCIFGFRSLVALPSVFLPHGHGQLAESAHSGEIAGAFLAVILTFGFAWGQWRTKGKWGLIVCVFAALTLAVQSILMFFAVNSGHVEATSSGLIKFGLFTLLADLALAISSLVSYLNRSGHAA